MKTNPKNKKFDAVEFMRTVRDELSALYNKDRKRYFEEIQKAMDAFRANRKRRAA